MFVDVKVLNRLIKTAYKTGGLHIEHTESGWITISGFYWEVEVGDEELLNKLKAQLVELIGDIPGPGEAYMFEKGSDPQSEVIGCHYNNRMEFYDKLEHSYEISNVLLKTANGNVSILQSGTAPKIMIPEWGTDLIDPDAVDYDELKPEPGRTNDKTPYIVWRNNVMALALMKRTPKYSGEREFMASTNESDFCWEFEVDEE